MAMWQHSVQRLATKTWHVVSQEPHEQQRASAIRLLRMRNKPAQWRRIVPYLWMPPTAKPPTIRGGTKPTLCRQLVYSS
jgi:hypothetical protein